MKELKNNDMMTNTADDKTREITQDIMEYSLSDITMTN